MVPITKLMFSQGVQEEKAIIFSLQILSSLLKYVNMEQQERIWNIL